MLIGQLRPADFDAAVELWQEAGLTRPWNDPVADLHRAIAGPASTVLAGLEGDVLLATAMVGHDGHRGWVYYLAVRVDAQRRGHGRAMIGVCEAWLVERNVPTLNLMLRTDNETARGFYAALGYTHDDDVRVLAPARLNATPSSHSACTSRRQSRGEPPRPWLFALCDSARLGRRRA